MELKKQWVLALEFKWVLASILCQSTANALTKMAGLNSISNSPLTWVINPWYPLALLTMCLQAFFWVQALKNSFLAIAYPMSSLVFGVNLVFAFFIFGEEITLYNLVGIAFIILGVGLILKKV